MATSANSHNLYDCRLCFSNFKLPVKVLLCGHSFCGSCLSPMGGQGQIQCPQCGMVTFLSAHGVPGLTNNYALHQMLLTSRSPSDLGIDFALMGPPPPVALPQEHVGLVEPPLAHGSRSVTPESFAVPSIQVTPFVSPIRPPSSQELGLVDMPAHSTIVIHTPASVVVGSYSMVVTDANCQVTAGKECRIFSHNPSFPQPPLNALNVSCVKATIGPQSSVFAAKCSDVTVGDSSDIWLGPGSSIIEVGTRCVWHTAVKGVYKAAYGV